MAKGERCRNEEDSQHLDQYAKDALDELFSKEQQTYEEFLQGFMFLKKEDVTEYESHSSQSTDQQGNKTDNVVAKSLSLPKSGVTENDYIPEEILGPGSVTPSILMRLADSSGRSFVQVDNFVDLGDDMSDEEEDKTMLNQGLLGDEFLSSSYSPSVSLCSASTSKSELSKDERRTITADLDNNCLAPKKICCLSEGVSNLPGEIEGQETAVEEDGRSKVSMEPNIRQLQISTRLHKDNMTSEHKVNMGSEGTDEVQPFTLDTEFDYDNVALTPKFSIVPGKHFLTFTKRD